MKAKFILFGLMVLLSISFISCQKNDEIKDGVKPELIATFNNAIGQYTDDYYKSEVPYTKSMNNEYISLIDAGKKLPLEVQSYIRQVIITSNSCESLDDLKEHMKREINNLSKLGFTENVEIGCVKSLSLYVTSIEIAVSKNNKTKGVITRYERESIGRAASNDSIASIVFGWAFGTATAGPVGGVYGAIGAMIWELL